MKLSLPLSTKRHCSPSFVRFVYEASRVVPGGFGEKRTSTRGGYCFSGAVFLGLGVRGFLFGFFGAEGGVAPNLGTTGRGDCLAGVNLDSLASTAAVGTLRTGEWVCGACLALLDACLTLLGIGTAHAVGVITEIGKVESRSYSSTDRSETHTNTTL